jgi:hypothetical protein
MVISRMPYRYLQVCGAAPDHGRGLCGPAGGGRMPGSLRGEVCLQFRGVAVQLVAPKSRLTYKFDITRIPHLTLWHTSWGFSAHMSSSYVSSAHTASGPR